MQRFVFMLALTCLILPGVLGCTEEPAKAPEAEKKQ